MYAEYKRILTEELEFFRYIQTLTEAARFMDEYMGVTANDLSYKHKIKGFHLAFNIQQKKSDVASTYKFRLDPNLTTEQIKLKVAQSKQKRILDKEVKEMDEKMKYQRDREELRKMHERLRLKKLKHLMEAQDRSGMDSEQRRKQYEYQAKLQEKMEQNEMRHQLSVDEVFKNRNMTFEDIEKLNYK